MISECVFLCSLKNILNSYFNIPILSMICSCSGRKSVKHGWPFNLAPQQAPARLYKQFRRGSLFYKQDVAGLTPVSPILLYKDSRINCRYITFRSSMTIHFSWSHISRDLLVVIFNWKPFDIFPGTLWWTLFLMYFTRSLYRMHGNGEFPHNWSSSGKKTLNGGSLSVVIVTTFKDGNPTFFSSKNGCILLFRTGYLQFWL